MKSLSPDPTEFITVAQAAREAGVSPALLTKRINAGQLPGERFGRLIRIPVAQWTAWKSGTWRPRPTPEPIQIVQRRVS